MDYQNWSNLHSKGNLLVRMVIGIGCVGSLVTGCGSGDPNPSEGSIDPSEGSIVFQDGEFEIAYGGPVVLDVELSDAVNRAVNRYIESPDVETCSELAEWYINGLEVAFEGELVGLIEKDPNIDTALQAIPTVRSALTNKMVDSLKRNDSLCPRNQDIFNSDIVIPELKPLTQKVVSLFEQHGASFSLQGYTGLKVAINIAEGRPLTFEYNRFSDDQQE